VILTAIAVVALVAVLFWEWYHDHPIIDLRLFRDRSFATANVLMFALGFVLWGTTLMIPLFVQTLMGYPAEQAGLVLMPGGLLIIALLPLVGRMLARFDPRPMMIAGLCILSTSMFYMSHFDLQLGFRNVVLARLIQGGGMAFLWVPINTVAYSYLPREKNNAASGLINLARNVGASMGISYVTTMLDRGAQLHQDRLAAHLDAGNPLVQQMLHGATAALSPQSGSRAPQQAYALLQFNVQRQAAMLSYIDNFRILAIVSLCLIPLVFLVKKPRKGGKMAVH
jgi:DHA2 family multidrug resistance protein